MIVTKDYIHQHSSVSDGWSQFQLSTLGVDWPPAKDWMNTVLGKVLTEKEQFEFENNKDFNQGELF